MRLRLRYRDERKLTLTRLGRRGGLLLSRLELLHACHWTQRGIIMHVYDGSFKYNWRHGIGGEYTVLYDISMKHSEGLEARLVSGCWRSE